MSMTAAIRVAVEICTYLFNCMFCGGICGVGSGIGGSDIGWVVMVIVVTIRYWWSSEGDVGDFDCCYGGQLLLGEV